MTTTYASTLGTSWEGRTRKTTLELEFTTRAGKTIPMTAPFMAPTLKTGTKPRPQGTLHDKVTREAVEVCRAVGLEFWAVSDGGPRRYWATDGTVFFLVHNVIQRAIITTTAVDAWGQPLDVTVEHEVTA